jgi:hypothetical protein
MARGKRTDYESNNLKKLKLKHIIEIESEFGKISNFFKWANYPKWSQAAFQYKKTLQIDPAIVKLVKIKKYLRDINDC